MCAVSVTAVLKVTVSISNSVSSESGIVRAATFPVCKASATSGSWETSSPGNVHAGSEALLHHDAVNWLEESLGCAKMSCGGQTCSPVSDHCRWQIPGASGLSRLMRCCSSAHLFLSSSHKHPLRSWRSSLLAPQGCLSLVSGPGLPAVDRRSLLQHHRRRLGHTPG